MPFRVLGNRVLLRPIPAPTMTPSGIALPDVAQDGPTTATVVSVGDGPRTDDGCGYVPIEMKPGQKVAIATRVGDEIEVDGEKLIVMLAGDVLGVLE